MPQDLDALAAQFGGQVSTEAPRPPMSQADIAAYMQSPEFQQAREQGMDAGAAEAAGPIMQTLGASALGGAAVGGGAVSGALRAAGSPLGQAAIQGGYEAITGGDPLSTAAAAGQGYLTGMGLRAAGGGAGAVIEKALSRVPLPASLKARLAHAIARGAKVAKEEGAAEKVVPIRPGAGPKPKPAPLKSVASATPDPEDVAARITAMNASGLSRGQIAEALREQLAPGGRGIGVGYFRKMTDMVLDAAKAK